MFRFILLNTIFLFSMTAYAHGSSSQDENKQTSISEINHATAATAADILSSIEQAEEIESFSITPLFTASAELGFLYKTGNTNSGDMKSGLDIRFAKGRWLSLLNVDLLLKKADRADENTSDIHFVTVDQKWTVSSQTNYSLGEGRKNYVYGNIWYEESKFNSFVNQSSVSTGWGRHWYKSQKASLWGDIGPGYKRDLFRATTTEEERTEDSWIIQVQALYLRKLWEHIEFKQYFSAKHAIKSNDNSIYKAESSITTKLISTLQLKFNFTLNYNTEVEKNKKNMDTQTAVTLVYSF